MLGKMVGIKKFWRWFAASLVFKFFIAVVIVALILFDFYRDILFLKCWHWLLLWR